jgi:CheY-like chemotaxis protein
MTATRSVCIQSRGRKRLDDDSITSEPERPLILPAEVVAGERTLMAHTRVLSPGSATVELDEVVAAGARVVVRISGPPRTVPLRLEGSVSQTSGSGALGDPVVLRVAVDRGPSSTALQAFLERLDRPEVRVLIVDDSPLMRDLLGYGVRKYFRRQGAGAVVQAAENGLAAWRHLHEGPTDLLIVDRYLPVLDGTRLIERVRAMPRFSSTQVIGVSSGGPDAAQAMLNAGADRFLPKPVLLRDLFSVLDSVEGRQQRADSPDF